MDGCGILGAGGCGGEGIMSIIAVSDTHIGAPRGNAAAFDDFLLDMLDRPDVSDLVLCGDILDFWRCDVMDMMIESAPIMDRLISIADEGVNVHYIAGNHDYIMRKAESKHKRINFSTSLTLFEEGGENGDERRWGFLHGWEFDKFMNPDYFDALCYANTTHGDMIRKTFKTYLRFLPPVEAFLSSLIGWSIRGDMTRMVDEHDKQGLLDNRAPEGHDVLGSAEFPDGGLVFGHLHMPYMNTSEKMINCGSWHRSYPVHNTFVEIDGSTVHLRRWQG